jgi:nicotinamide-nucleotide amidase
VRPLRVCIQACLILTLIIGATAPANIKAAPATNQVALDYFLVVTGEELLRGAFTDSHTAFITRTLHFRGGHCVGSMVVDDKREDIVEALRFGAKRAKLIIVTGGLGPTVNDGTREAVTELTGLELAEHPAAMAELERRMNQRRVEMRPNMRRQALVPKCGTYFKNPNGTAVGLVFEGTGPIIIALPGPPRELQPMVLNEMVPYLDQKYGTRTPGASKMIRFVGIGQSAIDQTMRQHVTPPPDLITGSVFEAGRVDFIFSLPHDRTEDRSALKKIEAGLQQHLGDRIYATDETSLESATVKLIEKRAKSLVIAEVGSRGHLASSLNAVPGIERLMKVAYVAPTEEQLAETLGFAKGNWKTLGAGADRARELAKAARKIGEFTIVIGEPGPDENNRSSVWVAFGSAAETLQVKRLPLQGSGELAHENLVTQVLDILRIGLR